MSAIVIPAGATAHAATVTTPDGRFTVVADDEAVWASGWADNEQQLWGHLGWAESVQPGKPKPGSALEHAIDAVRAYYKGDFTAVNNVPVRPAAAPFRRAVHDALRTIPPGQHLSYSQLAARAGNPEAVRAAGTACGRNAAALLIPCHRALRQDGTLGGFLYGVEIKSSLLSREAAGLP